MYTLCGHPVNTCSLAELWSWMVRPIEAAVAKSRQSCPTLCDPIDASPPGSPAPGILQARTLEWVAISFSNAWKWKVKVKLLSRVRLLVTPWTAAYQAPLSMGFSRQEYWSGVPLPSPQLRLSGSKSLSLQGVQPASRPEGPCVFTCCSGVNPNLNLTHFHPNTIHLRPYPWHHKIILFTIHGTRDPFCHFNPPPYINHPRTVFLLFIPTTNCNY